MFSTASTTDFSGLTVDTEPNFLMQPQASYEPEDDEEDEEDEDLEEHEEDEDDAQDD